MGFSGTSIDILFSPGSGTISVFSLSSLVLQIKYPFVFDQLLNNGLIDMVL